MEAAELVPPKLALLPESSKSLASVRRLAATLGASCAAIFVLCWAGTYIASPNPTHAFIGLFTRAEASSVQALAEGSGWALLFGALSGAAIAFFYNLFWRLERR